MGPCDRDAHPPAHAGNPLDVVQRHAPVHLEAVHHVERVEIMVPGAEHGSERVPVTKIDPDNPSRPVPYLVTIVRVKIPHQRFKLKWEYPCDAELRDAMNARLPLMRQQA